MIELCQQRLRLLERAPSDLTVEQHKRRKGGPAAGDYLTEVRVSGHDHPALTCREIEDRFIGSIESQCLADVDSLVAAVFKCLHHDW